jgi:ATP phosphoribosyltransferase regulatory subunit HisZ
LQNLAARGLGSFVKIDYQVIRGLAYYTGVVFEAFDAKGEFRAIAGGGRYDNLVKLISGGKVNLPALGFGMGDVVLLEIPQGARPAAEIRRERGRFCFDRGRNPPRAVAETHPGIARRRICRRVSAHARQAGQAIQARAGIEGGVHGQSGKRILRAHPQLEVAR